MEHAPASPLLRRDGQAIAPVEPGRRAVSDGKPGRWLGRATAFTLEPTGDPLFDRRLRPAGRLRDRWIVLTYRMDPCAPPLRPVIRFVCGSGDDQDCVLPGVALGAASWLGLLPADLDEIRLAAGPGFVLERVGLRGHAGVLAECLRKRPIRVVPALYNRLRGDARRYRDILRGACAVSPLARYPGWRAERLRSPAGTGHGGAFAIRLILPARRSDGAAVGRTIASLIAQDHRAWSLAIAWIGGSHDPAARDHDDPRITESEWNDTVPATRLLAGSDALGFLRPGDVLWPEALSILASRFAGFDGPECVYADEEVAGAVLQPRLKPDWSPDLARVTGYTGRPALVSRALIARLGDRPIGLPDGSAFDRIATSPATTVAHIPRILCTTEPAPDDVATRAQALDRHLVAIGSPARSEIHGGILDLHWPVPQPAPLASIVIPSRDRLDLIARVTEGVLRQTDYPAIELVIVDNGSTDHGVLRFYAGLRADPRVRIVPYPHPFNFSAMTNAGVRAAHGQVLVLLNNDIAVLEPGWLSALVGQAVRPEVGAVGARLLYADGTLQHAGVVVGLGGRAGHILRRRPGDAPGHLGRLRVAHEVSAVTAACLAVERSKYDAVGGFDEKAFAIDFNDVDFCLRLGATGLKTIWTPQATLSHLESVSRGRPEGDERR
ncbi:MAG: glycosyltransferase family 2 protein, partial [Methylobacterium sp.]